MKKTFYSHGKLLLSGEYVVLDGATSLAVPTVKGQSLQIEAIDEPVLEWESLDEHNKAWFSAKIKMDKYNAYLIEKTTDQEISNTLLKILKAANNLNSDFLKSYKGCRVITKLEFPQNWGLGSSSTLINNIAQWAFIDAFKLLWKSFSGSGYDIACAQSKTPIVYQLINKKPVVKKIKFEPPFKNQLYFIHLNKKQNSREGIAQYQKNSQDKTVIIKQISKISKEMIACKELSHFEQLINEHEMLISSMIKLPKVKELLFSDYSGAIKSLGAWGGDFILATGDGKTPVYFKNRGYKTVIPYTDMILHS